MRDREPGARWASTLHERLDLHPQARRATREFNPPQAIWDAVLRALEKGTDRCALVTTLVGRFASVVCLGNLQQSTSELGGRRGVSPCPMRSTWTNLESNEY